METDKTVATWQGKMDKYNKSVERWQGKLDAHEKSINSMLMGLAGGLLAFATNYVKDLTSPIPFYVQVLAGAAVVGASLSLTLGALRSWLRTMLYRSELARLDYDLFKDLGQGYRENTSKLDAIRDAGARKLMSTLVGQSEEVVRAALDKYFTENPDPLIRQAKAISIQADALGEQLKYVGWTKLMNRLEPVQIILFLFGAICLAGLVFVKLVA